MTARAFTIAAFCALTACGAGRTTQDAAPHKQTPRERDIGAKPSSHPSAATPVLESLGHITGTKSGEAFTCHIVHVGKGLLVTASHCVVNANDIEGSWPGQKGAKFPLRVVETVETKSVEVESLSFLTTSDVAFKVRTAVDLDAAFVEPTLSYPSPLLLRTLNENGISVMRGCEPRRYNEDGLIAYECETTGGMSGALVTREDGRPIGIHVGRLSGLGYGAAFLSFAGKAKERIAKDEVPHD